MGSSLRQHGTKISLSGLRERNWCTDQVHYCNNRFLLLPWITIHNLASRVLALSLHQLRVDWERQYEVTPYMVETFVDAKFSGTCYKTSNWTCLGDTKGYEKVGKAFVYHGQKKLIYVYVMDRQFAREFRSDKNRLVQFTKEDKGEKLLQERRGELGAMINGIPMWSPSLLNIVGLTDNPTEQIKQHFINHMERYVLFLGRNINSIL